MYVGLHIQSQSKALRDLNLKPGPNIESLGHSKSIKANEKFILWILPILNNGTN